MTDDYKELLGKYITGNIQPTASSNSEVIAEQSEIDYSVWENYLTGISGNFFIEGAIAPNDNTSSLGILYGGYVDSNNNTKGFLILFNQDFTPIKRIDTFSSGTSLRYIQCLRQAEDGTFYMIDDMQTSKWRAAETKTSQKRFVMINNFTIQDNNGDYTVNIRKSYNLTGNYVNFYCQDMYKDPNSSTYIFFGMSVGSSNEYGGLKIFTLVVNVGSANTWTMITNDSNRLFGSAIATFDENNNVRFRCLTSNLISSATNLILYSKTYTGSATSSTLVSFSYHPYIDTLNFNNQSVFMDYDNVYFVLNNQLWGTSGTPDAKYLGLYRYNFTNDILSTIFEESLGSFDYGYEGLISIDVCNGEIYLEYLTNITRENNIIYADYYYQRLKEDCWNPILIQTHKYGGNGRNFLVKANYNLLQVYMFDLSRFSNSGWFNYVIKEDYNSLNYSSTPYTDYNSLSSIKGEVYSNNSLVFARNLYNKTIFNNITTSTIQIPTSYLNDITLQPNILLSYTNKEIINDNIEWSKNRYENVLLNFVNTISVIDEDTNKIYLDTGSNITENVNGTNTDNTTMNEKKIAKININFEDNSTKTQTVELTSTGTNEYLIRATIYVSDAIESIDIISNDETQTYITLDVDDLTTGQYYTIEESLRIE